MLPVLKEMTRLTRDTKAMIVRPEFSQYITSRPEYKFQPSPKLPERIEAESFQFSQGSDLKPGDLLEAFWWKQHSVSHLDQLADRANEEEFAGLPEKAEETRKSFDEISKGYAEDVAAEPGTPHVNKLLSKASEELGFLVAPGGGSGELDQKGTLLRIPLHRQATNTREAERFGLIANEPTGALYVDTRTQTGFLADFRVSNA